MGGLAKLAVLAGIVVMILAVVLRVTGYPIVITGSAIYPSTLLMVANNCLLIGIALAMVGCKKQHNQP